MDLNEDIKINIPILNIPTYWFLGIDVDRYKKACTIVKGNDKICETTVDDCDGFAFGTLVYISNPRSNELIIHELTHLVDHIMYISGIKDYEVRAFIMGWLGEKILEEITDFCEQQTKEKKCI